MHTIGRRRDTITGRVCVTTTTETFDEVRSHELYETRVEVTRLPVVTCPPPERPSV